MYPINVVIILGSLVIGGAENMVYELARKLDKTKVNAIVISLSSRIGNDLEKKFDVAKIPVKYIDVHGHITIGKLLKVNREINKLQPQVIHAHMSGVAYSILWSLFHNNKLVVTAHTTPDKAFNRRTTAVLRILARLKKVVLVGVSEENRALMLKAYGVSEKSVICINNGVDIKRYYHKEHENVTFINVGRHDKNKNQQEIIRQFAKLHTKYKNMSLILCGDGTEFHNNKALAEQLGVKDSVLFAGNVPNVQDYLAQADIYVQASHREGLPLTTIEAVASGLPIIATDGGGIKNIVRENGLLIPDDDAEQLYLAMEKLFLDKSIREKYAEVSLQIAEEYSSDNMANRYTDVYLSCIKERG